MGSTDYPMVAASYAAQRSELAKRLGPGQIRRDRAPPGKAEAAAPPVRRSRPNKATAAAE